MSEKVQIEAIEDIRNFGGRLIASKGRKGIIDRSDAEYWGVGTEVKQHWHVRVLFDGNKIHREVPNKSLRLCGGDQDENI